MPDPSKDLADILEPAIPLTATASHDWLLPVGAVLIGIAAAIAVYWYWRRHAPLRALQRLRGRTDVQQAAGELAALRPQFKRAPEPQWWEELQHLRFGPPREDGEAVFERLCQEAMLSLTRRSASASPGGGGNRVPLSLRERGRGEGNRRIE